MNYVGSNVRNSFNLLMELLLELHRYIVKHATQLLGQSVGIRCLVGVVNGRCITTSSYDVVVGQDFNL